MANEPRIGTAMVAEPRLCVFAKAPDPGRVKTRLARHLGAAAACRAHEALVAHVLDRLAGCELTKELWVNGDVGHPQVAAWAQRLGATVKVQPQGDLGVKMHAAVTACCAVGHSALIVGSDLPQIDLSYIKQAAAALAAHDLVLGPVEDGGYGLVGLKAPAPRLFQGMAWSTPAVLADTRAQAERLRLRVAELPTTWDVDGIDDWRRFLGLQSSEARSAS